MILALVAGIVLFAVIVTLVVLRSRGEAPGSSGRKGRCGTALRVLALAALVPCPVARPGAGPGA